MFPRNAFRFAAAGLVACGLVGGGGAVAFAAGDSGERPAYCRALPSQLSAESLVRCGLVDAARPAEDLAPAADGAAYPLPPAEGAFDVPEPFAPYCRALPSQLSERSWERCGITADGRIMMNRPRSTPLPAQGARVSGEKTFELAFPLPGVTSVDFYVNGALVGSDVSAPYQVTVDTTGFDSSRGHEIRAIVRYDGGGQAEVSNIFAVI